MFRLMQVRDFDPRSFFRNPKAIKLADRKAQLAVAAAAMAFADAGLEQASDDHERIGISMGSGNVELQVEDLARAIGSDSRHNPATDLPFFARQILSNLNPLWLLVSLPNMISAHVSIQLQVLGPNTTLMTDWIAGSQAIGEAWLWIRSGEADCVLAGGADGGLSPLDLLGWSESGGCFRPFDKWCPGEGSAVLVLEELGHALGRNARLYGEIVSYASAGAARRDAGGSVLADCMLKAIEGAGWSPEEVDFICGAEDAGDEDYRTIRNAVGGHTEVLQLRSFKHRLGHLLAACGPVEMALLLHGMSDDAKSAKVLCNAIGSQGQAASIALLSPAVEQIAPVDSGSKA